MHIDDLPILEPCQEDWEAMNGDARRRLCAACSKHVHDLSAMTRPKARRLLENRPAEGICVRYHHDEEGNLQFQPPDRLGNGIERLKHLAVGAAIVAATSTAACDGVSDIDPGPMQAHLVVEVEASDEPEATFNILGAMASLSESSSALGEEASRGLGGFFQRANALVGTLQQAAKARPQPAKATTPRRKKTTRITVMGLF